MSWWMVCEIQYFPNGWSCVIGVWLMILNSYPFSSILHPRPLLTLFSSVRQVLICSSCYCTFRYLNLRHTLITWVSHNACPNVLFTWRDFNQLPDFLCCYTPSLETWPAYTLLSDTAHCARQPAANRRAGGGRRCWRGCVCASADESVVCATRLYMHVFVCLHVRVLMCVTGADSYVRGEVTPSLLSLGVCRGSYQLCKWQGEHLLPLHTHPYQQATHTQPPRYH